MKKDSFYITTTLPYVNAELHMGHALEFVRADAIARYKKLAGFDVFFNTGTDEHGIKMLRKAEEAGMDPQAFVDKSFENFKKSVEIFGMMNESEGLHFIRTTDEAHIKGAQEFWKRCFDNGYIYKKNYQTKYCVGCESEKSDSELVNGECPDHPGRPVELIEEENYFFKYSVFGDKLLKYYEANSTFVIPDFRFNEVKAFVERGLQDFSISRLKSKMPWGIPVPGDPEHVMYVWFDALTNYINTLGWQNPNPHPNPLPKGEGDDLFEKYWLNGTPTQYCGKDNTRFQSAMWQAMLMACFNDDAHCSKQIVVNGFIMGDGGVKMSKTLGNVVDPKEIVDEYGTDALRYFLLREISSFEDSPFSKERFKEAYNANLANGLGNLTSRVLTMSSTHNVTYSHTDIIDGAYPDSPYLNEFDIKKAMDAIWEKIRIANEFIQAKEPFKKIKLNKAEAETDILTLLGWLAEIALKLAPFMPETSKKLKELIRDNKKPEQPLFLRKD